MNELGLDFSNSIDLQNNQLQIEQTNFLDSTFGKVINTALDLGLKTVLPDLIEDQVIDIKNAIIENGFKEGISEVINSALNTGKSAIGLVTGNFENLSQIEMAVKKGGLIDKTSKLLDFAINMANDKKLINNDVSSIIKSSKNTIMNSISDKIEGTLTNQIKTIEKIEKYCQNWEQAYGNQDFSKMENAIKNINKNMEKVIPLENILTKARSIEIMHSIVEKTGEYDLSEEAIELAKRFQ